MGVIKGDTRSLDYSSNGNFVSSPVSLRRWDIPQRSAKARNLRRLVPTAKSLRGASAEMSLPSTLNSDF